MASLSTLLICALTWPLAQAAEVSATANTAGPANSMHSTNPATANLANQPVQVVYHVADGNEQALRALVNIRNHLSAEPSTKIVLVALGAGVDFLLAGAQEPNGKPFEDRIAVLASQGVQFRVCKNSLNARNIDPAKVLPEARIVSSGVAEVARLQAREGFAYIRP